MLKLKSIVKDEKQLLATGWEKNWNGYYCHEKVNGGMTSVRMEMFGRTYDGVIKDRTEVCELDGSPRPWTLYPEMVLLVDQWGFVRDAETLDIVMFDGVNGEGKIYMIDSFPDYPISVKLEVIGSDNTYTKGGLSNNMHKHPVLSKYPYSLTHGGYTPFDFEELKQAFDCPKVLEGKHDDSPLANDDSPLAPAETVTTYQADGYEYTLTRIKL